ncbi:MAG: ferrous iron transport protein A [Spirochaetes bacterium]|nr:ferrous iron transport protein A [Spirochaetota bacterium]
MHTDNTISALLVGQKALIVGFKNKNKKYRDKLLSMGLVKGTVFTITKIAPLGDPIEIEVRGFKLSLRKEESEILLIKKLNEG